MAIDQAKIGVVAAELMERLEAKYGDEAELDNVLLLVTVSHGAADSIEIQPSPGIANYVALGMLEQIKHDLLGRTQ